MSEKQPRAALYIVGAASVLLAVGGVALFASARGSAAERESHERESRIKAGPRVRVAAVTQAPAGRRLELQGEARAYASVTLYAKLSGYLKEMRVDKGDHVKAGQILAVIESPELDRQYDAAVADAAYKRANAKRAQALAGPGVVSARDAELADSQAVVAEQQVAALRTQKSYETLRAPWDGIVTARFADPGALVQNATNAQTGALPVATISQGERLRVYVYVDQRDAVYVREGDAAEVMPPERPGTMIRGTVTRLSKELDPKTRTMLVEVDLDNQQGWVVPGSFVVVALSVATPPALMMPVEALVMRGKKPFVAVVGADQRVTYRPIELAGDDGAFVQVKSGLKEGERVALNLGENVVDGDLVQPVEPAKNAK